MPSTSVIDVARLHAALADRWSRIQFVPETASTNADLHSDAGAPDRSVLIADYQSAGRGRLDRSWVSPRGTGLTFSVLLRPTTPLLTWPWLPLLTGVALREAIASMTDVGAALKWPNDLLAGGEQGKAAGILAQTGEDCVVIGVGLNVTAAPEIPGATSLRAAGAPELDRTELLIAILNAIDARYSQWADFNGDAEACGLVAAYTDACATIGKLVRVTTTGGDVLEGTATGLDGGGRLRVDVAGSEYVVGAGDVEHAGAL